MQLYRPSRILIEKNAADYPKTAEILRKFPDIPHVVVENYDWRTDSFFGGAGDTLTQGKKQLYLKVYKGAFLKPCPGFSPNVVCCNYHIIDFVENCPSECIYCILQAIQNRPVMTIHVNADDIVNHITAMIAARPDTMFRIGTGEFSDSLSMDHIANVNPGLVEAFGKCPNALLELKTKSDHIRPLLDLKHNGQTVVSWSIGTVSAGKTIELKTASPMQRINAAGKLAEKGYHTAFHFDPIILQNNAEEGYREIIEHIHRTVPEKSIGWFSMGSLRFMPKLKTIAEERFPKTNLFTSEFISHDGKQRYFRPLREKLYQTVYRWLNKYFPTVPVYMCMETETVWKNIFDDVPATTAETENRITRRFNIGGCGNRTQPSNQPCGNE